MFYLVAPLMGLTFLLAGSMGLVSYAYFVKVKCDPLASKFIKNPNQVCCIYRECVDNHIAFIKLEKIEMRTFSADEYFRSENYLLRNFYKILHCFFHSKLLFFILDNTHLGDRDIPGNTRNDRTVHSWTILRFLEVL